MKSLKQFAAAIVLLFAFTTTNAQIKNPKTETVKVYGNCGMCKKTIEKAANEKGVAKADWNVQSKLLTMTYDPAKTNPETLLQKVAAAGYDSDRFTATAETYNNLHGCCQYDRPEKEKIKKEDPSEHHH